MHLRVKRSRQKAFPIAVQATADKVRIETIGKIAVPWSRQMKTLLVAVRAEDRDQASGRAADEFRIYLASTGKEALSMLDAVGIDGIVCGMHFNDGDPFEFLHKVRSHTLGASVPFIVV
jgi:PleD family two-component response regulator